jgi:streptomycin 6-kinase
MQLILRPARTLPAMRIPRALARTWSHEPEWLSGLPLLATACAAEWKLELEDPIETPHSLVIPAGEVVLKLNAPSHDEADNEADALAHWGGRGAVRLLARDDERRALLIERCVPGSRLWDSDADEIDVMGELVPRLQIDLGDGRHPFDLLADEADRWAHAVPRQYAMAGTPFERRLLDAALDVYRTVQRSVRWLVNQDPHGGNVLTAEREPWLVIDPKPLVGERELEASGLLRNAEDVSRWLDGLADLGFDRERARGWGVAHNLAWAWDERRGWLDRHVEEARRILTAR